MTALRRAVPSLAFLLILPAAASAQSIRDRIRLSPEEKTPITEQQANELSLTLNDAAIRPIQVWIRTAGTIDEAGKRITAKLSDADRALVKVGQRVRVFPLESRASMSQAQITGLGPRGAATVVTATLSGPPHAGSTRYVLEIVTQPLEALSVPNEAIIESGGRQIVYVQIEKGRYEPREIQGGLQGELYTEVRDGLKPGEQVVTFGSFFIDADHRLKGFSPE